jgi:hypothetical protein
MKRYQLATKYRTLLRNAAQKTFDTKADWELHLKKLEITGKHLYRLATEGALVGSILSHGFPIDLAILSDDAGQFNVFQHALCWVHAERKIKELVPGNSIQAQEIEDARNAFWTIYNGFKSIQTNSNTRGKKTD